jgi:hypothetical protein
LNKWKNRMSFYGIFFYCPCFAPFYLAR